ERLRLEGFHQHVEVNRLEGYIKADLAPLILKDGAHRFLRGVASVGEELEGQRRAFFSVEAAMAFADTVAVFVSPAGFFQKGNRLFLIERIRLQFLRMRPAIGAGVGGGLNAEAIERALIQFFEVD